MRKSEFVAILALPLTYVRFEKDVFGRLGMGRPNRAPHFRRGDALSNKTAAAQDPLGYVVEDHLRADRRDAGDHHLANGARRGIPWHIPCRHAS